MSIIFLNAISYDKVMNKWIELLLGIILVIIPVYVFVTQLQVGGFWAQAILYVLAGGLMLGILFIGLLFLLLGLSDLKE